ncbi:hypothetical protein CDAR_64881 [Caerostris darwini]|uniref:Uncharacterized protein n=1 Tax=Caerostris darwini TaxID=1538125 RepID=A0AAV4SKT8_9ARAC|nr:hypothetical protein CDAR_64881 [Caerostris darwini]
MLLSAIFCIGLPDTRHLKNLQTLHDAEMFGKYWKWKDYFTSGPKKTDHKNGILKGMEKKPQSPILGQKAQNPEKKLYFSLTSESFVVEVRVLWRSFYTV